MFSLRARSVFAAFLMLLLVTTFLHAVNPTPDSGRLYYFFNYLANGVPASGYDASPYLPEGMKGIGLKAAEQIWLQSSTIYKGPETNIDAISAATLSAASDLYGSDSMYFSSVEKAWKAINVVTPKITVTNPTTGSYWRLGMTYTINWTYAGNAGSTVKILLNSLYYDTTKVIKASAPIGSNGQGSFVIEVPCNTKLYKDFNNFTITVQSNQTSTQGTTSSFRIAKHDITITSPSSSWYRGWPGITRWNSHGNIGPKVDIILWRLSPYEVYTLALGVPSGYGTGCFDCTGTFTWPVPSNWPTGTWQVGVTPSCYTQNSYDIAGSYFFSIEDL